MEHLPISIGLLSFHPSTHTSPFLYHTLEGFTTKWKDALGRHTVEVKIRAEYFYGEYFTYIIQERLVLKQNEHRHAAASKVELA